MTNHRSGTDDLSFCFSNVVFFSFFYTTTPHKKAISMHAILVTLASALVALCSFAQASTRIACVRGHNHIRTVHTRDHCAHALHAPKVALLFLTTGPLPHEELWRRWFIDIGSLAFSGCAGDYGEHFLECTHERNADPIGQQQLFTVPHYSAYLAAVRTASFVLKC